MIILGFDPGGKERFGWCVAQSSANGHLQPRASGIASDAFNAVEAALSTADDLGGVVKAAGIDCPLLWVTKGDRKADKFIRSAMRGKVRNVGGTVQQVNSLRGACLSQGVMAAHLLRLKLPDIRITESHPKALLWLRDVKDVGVSHLIEPKLLWKTEHERDAALGAFGALAMIEKRSGWRDLYLEEENAYTPVSPVEYWMPDACGALI